MPVLRRDAASDDRCRMPAPGILRVNRCRLNHLDMAKDTRRGPSHEPLQDSRWCRKWTITEFWDRRMRGQILAARLVYGTIEGNDDTPITHRIPAVMAGDMRILNGTTN